MSIDELAKGFRKRTLVTATLAGKVGLKMARRTFVKGKANEPDAAEAVRAARQLVTQLGAFKGLVMKIGQMASYLPGALPPEAQAVLAKLQAESTAMSYERIRDVVEAELGAAPEALFEHFEPEPFAAASIGQVHRARLEGREVAVKVQYPGIEEVLASDLSTIGWAARVSTLGLPIDAGALVDELRTRIVEECDYELEARNQQELAALMRGDPGVHVPAVIGERSSRRVLTTELVDAARFGPFVEGATQEAKDRAAGVIFRTCFRTLFRHGVYNGDPHPGNYLFHPDGRVTFLDFGCVRRFDRTFIERWKAFARGVIDGDRGGFSDRFRALGLVGREKSFDYDAQWRATLHLYEPFTQVDPFFTYTDEYVAASYSVLLFDNPNQLKTAMPPEWLLLNRLQWGLNAVLAKLSATGPWPRWFREAVEGPFDAPTAVQTGREGVRPTA